MKIKKWYNNLTIKNKLRFSVLNIVAVMMILGIMGIFSVVRIESQSREMYERYNRGIEYLNTISVDVNQTHTNAVVLVGGGGAKDDIVIKVSNFRRIITSNFEQYKGLIRSQTDLKKIAGLEKNLNSYLEDQAEVVRLYMEGQEDDAYDLLYGQADETHLIINDTLVATTNRDVAASKNSADSITNVRNIFLLVILGAILLGIILALTAITSLNKSIAGRIGTLMDVTSKVALGDVNVRIDDNLRHRDEIGSLAKEMHNMIEAIRHQAEIADKIAAGDLSVRCGVRSEEDVLSTSINTMADQVESVASEIEMIGQAATEGRLGFRGDTSQFNGAYKELVEGLYNSLDEFRKPILFVSEVLEGMAAGKEVASLDREFPGDYNILLSSLKSIYSSIEQLYNEINKLLEASENGDLRLRADESKVSGSYAYMINGINGILDRVTAPIREAGVVLAKMSKGDLTNKVVGHYKGDYAVVKNSLNLVIDNFNEILNNIISASDQVAAGASQISDSSILLSEGTTEQASSIQQLTASTEEISSQTRFNADNAEVVAKLTQSSKNNGEHGNNKMKELLVAMNEINESSNNISSVIKVIEDIAFQTNILALNAAVEAARAGQYGKGFAVVAEEVKNLAQRSANAAKETTEMIENSISKSENGKIIANETAENLIKLVSDSEEIANLVDDITKASREQAIGIDQINQGIMQVSEVVQTNSATSEETAAASEELASQADILKDEVNRFKISNLDETSYNSKILNPDVDKMLDNMSSKEKSDFSKEAAIAKDKPTINLDDSDFGKYQ